MIAGDTLLQGAGTYFSTVCGPAALYPEAAKFSQDFTAQLGSMPQPFAAQSYDCAAILLKAIEKVAKDNGGNIPTRADVCRAVRCLQNFPGLTATLTFNGNGDPVKGRYFIIQVSSSNPALWAMSRVVETLDVEPPQ
jgi:branched-chain amino acid transport system substrate-binding protein